MKELKSTDPEFLEFLGTQESQYLLWKGEWADEVQSLFAGDDELSGDLLPWSKTHPNIQLRPQEVSIWASANGHGKSLLTGQVALWLSRHTKVLIASLEMSPSKTLARMIRQAAGVDTPSAKYIDQFFLWKPDNLWIYDQVDTVEADRIIAMTRYAARQLGVKHVFIDSLMKLGLGTDDYTGQKNVIDRLCWVAKSEKIHIHLIHHIRKGDVETKRPGKYDVKGAGELVDMCDNLFIPWRNKIKEAAAVKARVEGNESPMEAEPDMFLMVEKQRHGEWEGGIGLWREPKSLQYIPRYQAGPMPFELNEEA